MKRSSGHTEEGKLYHIYEIAGRNVRLIDDWSTAMLIKELIGDTVFSPDEKMQIIASMVLPDPNKFFDAFNDEPWNVLIELLWDAFGFDLLGKHTSEAAVIDWDVDAERISATMLSAYGLQDDAWMHMGYRDVASLIGLAPHETPMGQALYYRTAKRPKATKHNKEELLMFDKARRFYSLERASNNETATNMFDKIAKVAING